jgi:hypothetical protein
MFWLAKITSWAMFTVPSLHQPKIRNDVMTMTAAAEVNRLRPFIPVLALLAVCLGMTALAFGQTDQTPKTSPPAKRLLLEKAVMCEGIQEYAPINPAAVFSIGLGRISCFTLFDPIPQDTVIYHSWFRRDVLITTKRLKLRAPRWGTFSSIQLREADKGPWRVEVHDKDGNILDTLRFSITD